MVVLETEITRFHQKSGRRIWKKVSKLILKSGVVPNACAGFLCFILNRSFCCSFGVLLLQLWCASLGSSYSSQIPLLHHLNTLLVPPSPLPPVQFCTVQTGVLAPLNRDIWITSTVFWYVSYSTRTHKRNSKKSIGFYGDSKTICGKILWFWSTSQKNWTRLPWYRSFLSTWT